MPPLDREKLASHLSREINGQLELFDSLWPLYNDPHDTNPPHRQRTATNRLLGYAMFLGLDPKAKRGPGTDLRAMRAWQKRLGPLRDWDVIWRWLGEFARRDKQCAAIVQNWSESLAPGERRKRWEPVQGDARGLPGAEARIARAAVGAHLEKAVKKLADAPGPFDSTNAITNVLLPWRQRLEGLRTHHGNDALHAFRVANKRLRFVADVLAAAGEDGPAEQAAPLLAETHTTLGNLSDLWVLREWLLQRRSIMALAGDPAEALAPLEHTRAKIEEENFAEWLRAFPRLLAIRF